MAWWPIGKKEQTGDGPVARAREALEALARQRDTAGKPGLGIDDTLGLLAAALGRSSRELQTRKNAKFTSVRAVLDDGSEREATVEQSKPAPEEVALVREAIKKLPADYQEIAESLGRKRPTANEVLEAMAVVLRAAGEAPRVKALSAIYTHAEGQIGTEEVVAAFAAALRRNERRLGLLVEGGEKLSPEEVVGTTPDGRTLRVSCADGQAPRELVDDLCDRFEAVIRAHRQEEPEKFLATLTPQERERYQRNADARGLPPLTDLIERVRDELAETPERWAPLLSLEVITEARSGIGLPSRPKPVAFVDSRLRVRHGKFGEGVVERTFEDGEKKYEVLFDGGKRVTLLARFLELIEPASPSP